MAKKYRVSQKTTKINKNTNVNKIISPHTQTEGKISFDLPLPLCRQQDHDTKTFVPK
jgi:hypothetical protein